MRYGILLILFLSGTAVAQTRETELARSTYAEKIYRETVIAPKLELYNRWLQKFPPANFPHSLALYDFVRAEMAKAYILQKKIKNAQAFTDGILVDGVKAEIWFDLANTFSDRGYMDEAERFLRLAWSNAYEYVKKKGTDPVSVAIISRFPEYSLRISQFLHRPGNEKEALYFIKTAFENIDGRRDEINIQYVIMLGVNGYDSLARSTAENLIRSGSFDYELRMTLFHLVFLQEGKDSATAVMERFSSIANNSRKAVLSREIIDIPAPSFSLLDLYGKQVSLSDYRGKTVVLDFWATWCIPCLESFTYIQRVVNAYKEDSMVKFLFIHTWEKSKDAPKKAQKLLAENKYDFHVLLDMKDPVTEVNKVVESYNIEALPAKAIIDKLGRIRILKIANWKKESSDGNAMEELAAMIELVRGEK